MEVVQEIEQPAEWEFDKELVKSILDKIGRDDRHTKKSLAENPPVNLARLDGQVFARNGKTVTLENQYLHKPVWEAFQK